VRLAVAPEEPRPDDGSGVVHGSTLPFEESADDEDAGLFGGFSPGPERGTGILPGLPHLLGEL
jgi:hypothetical protein